MVRNSFFDPNLLQQMMPRQGSAQAPVLDLKVFLEIQRKNAQAVADAWQLGFETAQSALSRQAEIVGRIVQDNSQLASTLMTDGTPEQKVQRQADMVRKSYEQTVKGAREVSDIWSRSGEEAADIINRRVSASLTEMKCAFDTPQAAAAQWQKNAETAWNTAKYAANETANVVKEAQKPVKAAAKKTTRRTTKAKKPAAAPVKKAA